MLGLFTMNTNTIVILSIAIILCTAFLMTRLTKALKLPNVTGYILAGILIGPYVLNIVPSDIILHMGFVTDVALSFIAFGVGRYLKIESLKHTYKDVLVITLFESLTAAFVVTLSMIYIFKLPVPFSILIGAIGCATAPASTIMTIRQYKAKGKFVDMILQVVALDDAVALIAFSVCTTIIQAIFMDGAFSFSMLFAPIMLNIGAVCIGIFMGYILHKIITPTRTKDNRLILSITVILFMCGMCAAFDISPLLACMALGTAYINFSDNDKLFSQIDNFSPPVLMIFFVLSGMRLNLLTLKAAGIIGVSYFFIRILGKYLGAYLGSCVTHSDSNMKKYFGLALIPQAGVAIGMSILGERILPPEYGQLLTTIILSSSVLYEMVGPLCAKLSLKWSKTIE